MSDLWSSSDFALARPMNESGPAPETGSDRRTYNAQWTAWWAAAIVVTFGALPRIGLFAKPDVEADALVKLLIVGVPVVGAAAFAFAGHLVRRGDRGGWVLSMVLLVIVAVDPHLFLLGNVWSRFYRLVALGAGLIGVVLTAPAWSSLRWNTASIRVGETD